MRKKMMKNAACRSPALCSILSIGVLIGLMLVSCAPKKPVETAPEGLEPSKEILAEVDRTLAEGRALEALALLDDLLRRAPDGPAADEALLKRGGIRQQLGRLEDAKKDYLLLLRKFPNSPASVDALLGLVEIFYGEGDYGQVLSTAAQVMQRPASTGQIFRLYVLLGDTHVALEDPKDAVLFYAMAGQQAAVEQKGQIRTRMKQAVRQLTTPEIETLLGRVEDPLAVGYLLHQLALNQTESDNFEAAVEALNRFLERFPDHEYAPDAEALATEINSSYSYRPRVLGCLLPLSGPYQIYGNRALKGIELALHRIGSYLGQPRWKLMVRDTGSDPDRAVSAVREFFSEKVAAVIGPIIAAQEAAGEAQALGIPIVVLSQKEGIPATGSFVFRNFMTPQMQVQTLLSHLVRERGMNRFGVFFPEEPYGHAFMAHFWDQADALGAEVVAVQPYDGEKTDFADPIRSFVGLSVAEKDRPQRGEGDSGAWGPEGRFYEEALLGTARRLEPTPPPGSKAPAFEDLLDPAPIVDFEALFIPDAAAKIAMIVPQLAYYDVNDVVLLGTNLWHSERLLEMAGEYMQGALIADGYFAQSTRSPVVDFTDAYRSAYGEDPGFIEAVAHDTASILFDIVGRSRSKFRSGIRDELLTVQNYPGVTGPTSFDSDGEVRKRLYLIQIKGRGFTELSAGAAAAR